MTNEINEGMVSEKTSAYTPGLSIKSTTTVTKIRRLPIPGKVYVKVGDKVNYDTIVARTEIKGDPVILNMSELLDSEVEDAVRYVKVKEGDQVSKGDIIAGYSILFGLLKKWVYSPIDGIIESVSDLSSQVIFRGLPIPVDVNAYIPGKVVEVLPSEGAIIETNAAFIQGILGVGGATHGKIRMAVESPDEELTAEHVLVNDKGTVLVGGSLVTLDAITKSVEVGVSSIVVGGIQPIDLTTFMGYNIGVALTGDEDLGLTLIITEGFGKMKMSQRAFDILKDFEGHMASINGATQIRAGVLRPEIIIPHKEKYEKPSGNELALGMMPGTPVRIIRDPYFGFIGKVLSLPVELQQIQSLSRVRVVEVELEEGEVVTVPRANVEIIEE